MYRRPKFLELLIEIRQRMAREADYDVDLFAAKIRGGSFSPGPPERHGKRARARDGEGPRGAREGNR